VGKRKLPRCSLSYPAVLQIRWSILAHHVTTAVEKAGQGVVDNGWKQ
jgi:hypothetical protein